MSSSDYPLAPDPALEWTGAKRDYDLIREFAIALVAVALLTVLFAALFSSPDAKPVTIARWANAAPRDFVATALSELDGTSGTAAYGPPYTHAKGASQNIIGGISLERAVGVHIPIDPAQTFVLDPLSIPAQSNPPLAAALNAYHLASTAEQQAWASAYAKGLDHATFAGRNIGLPTGRYGPDATLMASLLTQARSGGLDGALIASSRFYQTDYTKPILSSPTGATSKHRQQSNTCSAASGE